MIITRAWETTNKKKEKRSFCQSKHWQIVLQSQSPYRHSKLCSNLEQNKFIGVVHNYCGTFALHLLGKTGNTFEVVKKSYLRNGLWFAIIFSIFR